MLRGRQKLYFLHSEVMGYTEALLRHLALKVDVVVYHQREALKTPHQIRAIDGVDYRSRERMDPLELSRTLDSADTVGVFASGWNHKNSRCVLKAARRRGIPTIIGLDNHWRGDWRQRISVALGGWLIRQCAGGIFAAGAEQYEFARRIGFHPDRIELGLYSADSSVFSECAAPVSGGRDERVLLYVGRLVEIKGILPFAKTFSRVVSDSGSPWILRIAGSGPLEEKLRSLPSVDCLGFVRPELLAAEFRHADAFVLPSLHEPWGVVVHEAALCGLPLLISQDVGAARAFVVGDLNGFRFNVNCEQSREHGLRQLLSVSDSRLLSMGAASARLGASYTVEDCAARMLSLLSRQKHGTGGVV